MNVQLKTGAAKHAQRATGRRDITAALVHFQHSIRETLKTDLNLGPAESPNSANLFGGDVIGPGFDDDTVAITLGTPDE